MRIWVVANTELGEKFEEHGERHHRAALALGLDSRLINPLDIIVAQRSGSPPELVSHSRPDVAVFLDKDVHLAESLEACGVKVSNSAKAIRACDDKREMHIAFSRSKIPTPTTIILPRPYPSQPHHPTTLLEAAKRLGFPLVAKASRGSFGAQVYLINDDDELIETFSQNEMREAILQELVVTSYGRDIRVHVASDRVICAISQRSSDDSLQANLTQGGIGEVIKPNGTEIDLALRAARAVGTDFCGVDLLIGEGDTRLVCEVNSNPHITRLSEITNIDCAKVDILSAIGQQTSTSK